MRLTQPAWTVRWPTPLVLGLARLGPIGPELPAPGTWGSAAGLIWVYGAFWRPELGLGCTLALILASSYCAVALCGEAELRLGKSDPGEVILDEFVAMPLCFLGWPALLGPLPPWALLLAGFGLFRFFDIAKPLGIRRLQALPGGWGVVIDDLAAALAACATLHVAKLAWLWVGSGARRGPPRLAPDLAGGRAELDAQSAAQAEFPAVGAGDGPAADGEREPGVLPVEPRQGNEHVGPQGENLPALIAHERRSGAGRR
jgi:phosphatidylglycerophosphatase A